MKSKKQKREESNRRVAIWQALTPTQQLDNLNKAFGEGKGATKQRAKLNRILGIDA